MRRQIQKIASKRERDCYNADKVLNRCQRFFMLCCDKLSCDNLKYYTPNYHSLVIKTAVIKKIITRQIITDK